ncbi:MAG: nicotinate-nucleotide diphosphorylase (carboxylating) [Bacteroidetes bacterium SW_11_45_7]|nr:MAG: nicotinate-nucleotide diphosphorylase (carboxylating) [Bacteroidetes bacterium SW_11_45_7]
MDLEALAKYIIQEDTVDPKGYLPPGDHSSLACIPEDAINQARLRIKEAGFLAGTHAAKAIFNQVDPQLSITDHLADGTYVEPGDIAFTVSGKARSILTAERSVLNIMQRMSGIASVTAQYAQALEGTGVRVLDTRKTIPGLRMLDKEAVRIGGGTNHRLGLYDMILLKDNHVDYAGGIANAIRATKSYLDNKELDLEIELEVRSFIELQEALDEGGIHRVMLDNFDPSDIAEAVNMVNGRFTIEVSGGITLATIRSYALKGVDYISVGAITHSARGLDMSLKADVER